MTIRIEITDPLSTAAHELLAVADLLTVLASKTRLIVPSATPRDGKAAASAATIRTTDPAPGATIAPDDNPATGLDAAEIFAGGADPATVFAGGVDPAQIFGKADAGNVPAAPIANDSANAAAPASATNSAPASTVDLDANGLPWDARIHSSNKSKTAKNVWQRRRGVEDATVAQVEAELRSVLGTSNVSTPPPPAFPTKTAAELGVAGNVSPPPPPPQAPATATTTAAPPPPPVSTMPDATLTPSTAASATAVPPPPPANPAVVEHRETAAAAAPITFPQLCAKITSAINANPPTLTQARLGEVFAAHKLQGLPTLAAFPHLVQPVAEALGLA